MYNNVLFKKVEEILSYSEKKYPKIKKHKITIEWCMDRCEKRKAHGICEIFSGKPRTYRISLNPMSCVAQAIMITLIHEIAHVVEDIYNNHRGHGKKFKKINKAIDKGVFSKRRNK